MVTITQCLVQLVCQSMTYLLQNEIEINNQKEMNEKLTSEIDNLKVLIRPRPSTTGSGTSGAIGINLAADKSSNRNMGVRYDNNASKMVATEGGLITNARQLVNGANNNNNTNNIDNNSKNALTVISGRESDDEDSTRHIFTRTFRYPTSQSKQQKSTEGVNNMSTTNLISLREQLTQTRLFTIGSVGSETACNSNNDNLQTAQSYVKDLSSTMKDFLSMSPATTTSTNTHSVSV